MADDIISDPAKLVLKASPGWMTFEVVHKAYTSGVYTTVDVEIEDYHDSGSLYTSLTLAQVAELQKFCEAVLAMRGESR